MLKKNQKTSPKAAAKGIRDKITKDLPRKSEFCRVKKTKKWSNNLQLYPIQHLGHWLGYLSNGYLGILLMEEILHYLGCINPCKSWDKLATAGAGFQPSTVWIPGHAFFFWHPVLDNNCSRHLFMGCEGSAKKNCLPPLETNEYLLKMDGWKVTFVLKWSLFRTPHSLMFGGDLKVFWANL